MKKEITKAEKVIPKSKKRGEKDGFEVPRPQLRVNPVLPNMPRPMDGKRPMNILLQNNTANPIPFSLNIRSFDGGLVSTYNYDLPSNFLQNCHTVIKIDIDYGPSDPIKNYYHVDLTNKSQSSIFYVIDIDNIINIP